MDGLSRGWAPPPRLGLDVASLARASREASWEAARASSSLWTSTALGPKMRIPCLTRSARVLPAGTKDTANIARPGEGCRYASTSRFVAEPGVPGIRRPLSSFRRERPAQLSERRITRSPRSVSARQSSLGLPGTLPPSAMGAAEDAAAKMLPPLWLSSPPSPRWPARGRPRTCVGLQAPKPVPSPPPFGTRSASSGPRRRRLGVHSGSQGARWRRRESPAEPGLSCSSSPSNGCASWETRSASWANRMLRRRGAPDTPRTGPSAGLATAACRPGGGGEVWPAGELEVRGGDVASSVVAVRLTSFPSFIASKRPTRGPVSSRVLHVEE